MKLVVYHVKEKDWEKAHKELEKKTEFFKPRFAELATSGYMKKLGEFLKATGVKYHRADYEVSSETASNPENCMFFVSDAGSKAKRMFLEKPKLLEWQIIPSFEEDPDPEEVPVTEPVQYVEGSKRQRAYWRKKPYHYDAPTLEMRKVRRMLTKTAHTKGRDKFGTAQVVDKKGVEKTIPASAVPIKENMTGLRVAKPKPIVVPAVSPVDRLRRIAELLAMAGT